MICAVCSVRAPAGLDGVTGIRRFWNGPRPGDVPPELLDVQWLPPAVRSNMHALLRFGDGPSAIPPPYRPSPVPGFEGCLLDPLGYNASTGTLNVCHACYDKLEHASLPHCSLINGWYRGCEEVGGTLIIARR